MAKVSRLQPPQERRNETEENGFGNTIERRAVERTGEMTRPEKRGYRRASPEPLAADALA